MKEAQKNKKAARMSDAAVQVKTGKTWSEWFALLNAVGAREMDHKAIAAYLYNELGVPAWWNQMVAVCYEQAKGLREKYQRASGYEISRSKTIAVPLTTLYKMWREKKTRARWLKDNDITIRTARPNKSMRITWVDGKTHVEVDFFQRGKDKSQVTVQHGKLPDAREAKRKQLYWTRTLDRLKEFMAT